MFKLKSWGKTIFWPRPFQTVGKFGKNMKIVYMWSLSMMVILSEVKLYEKSIAIIYFCLGDFICVKSLLAHFGPFLTLLRGKYGKIWKSYTSVVYQPIFATKQLIRFPQFTKNLFKPKSWGKTNYWPCPFRTVGKCGKNMKILYMRNICMMVLLSKVNWNKKSITMVYFNLKHFRYFIL